MPRPGLWQYWLWSFKSEDTKFVNFKAKDEFVQRRLQYLLTDHLREKEAWRPTHFS